MPKTWIVVNDKIAVYDGNDPAKYHCCPDVATIVDILNGHEANHAARLSTILEAQLVAANKRIAALETVVMYARRCEAECPHWRHRHDGVIRTANLHNSLILLDEGQGADKPEEVTDGESHRER